MSLPSFEQLVADHGLVVLRVCRAVVGPSDAEDAWSETFLAELIAYPRLRADSNIRGWLVTIAHHKAIDRLRANHRAPVPMGALPETTALKDGPADPQPELWQAIAALPPKQRGAVAYQLPRRSALRRDRRAARYQRGRCSALCGRRHRQAPYRPWAGGRTMTTAESLQNMFASSGDAETLGRLHARLVEQAAAAQLLDVAYRTLDSPVGTLLLAATPAGLVRVAYPNERHDHVLAQLAERISPRLLRAPAQLDPVAHQLDEYFSHHRRRFDLPLAHGFRRSVLDHLPEIAYGTTASYATIAAAAGSPKAVRAVGSARATNPLPVIVPCHRVVRSDGTLGGYVGGLVAKRTLLHLEATP